MCRTKQMADMLVHSQSVIQEHTQIFYMWIQQNAFPTYLDRLSIQAFAERKRDSKSDAKH